MAEIGVKCLAAGHYEKYRAHCDEPDFAVLGDEGDCIVWIERIEHVWIVVDVHRTGDGDREKPDDHDRSEQSRDLGGAATLRCEQCNQNNYRKRRNVIAERRTGEL